MKMLVNNITRQPSADSRIKPLSCNGGRHIGDSKVKMEIKEAKTEHDEIQTMNDPACLLSKIYPSEVFDNHLIFTRVMA